MSDMNCNECITWLHAYLDNELDTATASQVLTHLDSCAACKARFGEMEVLHNGIRQGLPYFEAPKTLQRRVLSQIHSHATARELPRTEVAKTPAWYQWFAPAFSVATLLLALQIHITTPSAEDQLADEVVSSHVRSLMGQHLNDVVSSDRHTVKPWFTGKLDFSLPVYDFTQYGYPLLGGRLDYIAQKTVAALSYRRNMHIINVFVMPTTQANAGMHSISKRGFNLVSWRQDHLAFEAVSDLSREELEGLGQLIASQQ
jgi:anti-sigma factor RsiW